MKFALVAAVSLSVLAPMVAARAGEGGGDPFPFRASGLVTIRPSVLADTGSAAYPDFSSRPGQVVAEGQATLPPNGSEGEVQTASSLPPRAFDASPAVMQARATNRFLAMAAARRTAAQPPARANHG